MSKEDKKNVYNQMAWILNYQPTIKEQHIHMGEKPVESQQEMSDDEEKRKRLMATNTVIRTENQSGQSLVDLLALYRFVDIHFVGEINYKYEWYALRRFLMKYRLLRECDNEQFADQMNSQEWYAHSRKSCEANEMNNYSYLNNVQPELWCDTDIQLGSRATKHSVANIYKTYSNLEINKDKILSK